MLFNFISVLRLKKKMIRTYLKATEIIQIQTWLKEFSRRYRIPGTDRCFDVFGQSLIGIYDSKDGSITNYLFSLFKNSTA